MEDTEEMGRLRTLIFTVSTIDETYADSFVKTSIVYEKDELDELDETDEMLINPEIPDNEVLNFFSDLVETRMYDNLLYTEPTQSRQNEILDFLSSTYFSYFSIIKHKTQTKEEKIIIRDLIKKYMFYPDSFLQEISTFLNSTSVQEFYNGKEKFIKKALDLQVEFRNETEKIETAIMLLLYDKLENHIDIIEFMRDFPSSKVTEISPRRTIRLFGIINIYDEILDYIDDLVCERLEILFKELSKMESLKEKVYKFLEREHTKAKIVLPKLKSTLPKSHTMPIGRLANELQHDIIDNGVFDLVVAGRNQKNEITTRVIVTMENNDNIQMTGKPYTEYDRAIHDTVCSLSEYGHPDKVFTPEMLVRALTNNTTTKHSSLKEIESVIESLEKMRRIHVLADATEEAKQYDATIDSYRIDSYLLNLDVIEVSAGGKKVRAYKLLSEPVLLEYSKITGQFTTVNAELLDVKEVDKKGKVTAVSLPTNEKRTAVRNYLLRRVSVMIHDKREKRKDKQKQSNVILFDTLFSETGIPKDNHSGRIKEYIYQILDYWKATGYIKDYLKRESTGNGRKNIDAVIISL